MNEWIQFSPTAADDDHCYSQEPQPKSDPARELMAPLQSLGLELQQVAGEGQWQRMPCWTSEMPGASWRRAIWSLGCIGDGSVYVLREGGVDMDVP